jgi:ribosomal protein S8
LSSSAVEQWIENPCVGGSIPPSGKFINLDINLVMDNSTLYFLVKLKNFSVVNKPSFVVNFSSKIKNIVQALYKSGVIQSYNSSITQIYLKKKPVFRNLEIVSTPSNLRFLTFFDIVRLQVSPATIMILSTDRGILSHLECQEEGIGGVFLFIIW